MATSTVVKQSKDYLLNVIAIGAVVPAGNNSSTHDISNSIPSGYSFIESVLVCTPNDNWIRANSHKLSNTTINIVFTNEFSGSITGNWKVLLILEKTA